MHKSLEKTYKKFTDDFEILLNKCAQLTSEELNEPISKGKWSVGQILTHINLAIKNCNNYLLKKLQTPENIPPTNFTTFFRYKLLNTALKSDLKFKAPRGIDIIQETNAIEKIQEEWSKQNGVLSELLESFPTFLLKKAVFRHPSAGRITIHQTLEFMHLHILHHKRQIERHLQSRK